MQNLINLSLLDLGESRTQIRDLIREIENYRLKDYLHLVNELSLHDLLSLADKICKELCGNYVSFTHNIVVNYTNICVARCPICAFSRSANDPDAYVLAPDEVARIVQEAYLRHGVLEVHLNGGLNPELGPEYFEEMFRKIKQRAPKVRIKGLTCCEIAFYSKIWRCSVKETISRLRDAGLDMLSGGCLEIYNNEVRRVITPAKISGDEWFRIAETCYKLGVMVNATMLFGHIETMEHIIEHLLKVREFQEKCNNIVTFIPLKFIPENTELKRRGVVKQDCSADYVLKVIALSRIVLRDVVKRISAYWVSIGKKVAQIALTCGANDLVGTMLNERVFKSTGRVEYASIEELSQLVREINRQPVLRDSFGNIVKVL